ncbi:MAG: hypothetical protein R3F02_15530 [Thiolinea sp.]
MKRLLARGRLAALVVVLVSSLLTSASAGTRLDDSTSPRSRVEVARVLSERGQLLENDLYARYAVLRVGQVDYRLAMAAYVGQQVKIYYVIPPHINGLLSPDALKVSWSAGNDIAGGFAHAGDRVLVWSGLSDAAWKLVTLDLTIQVELEKLHQDANTYFGIEPYFEVEIML